MAELIYTIASPQYAEAIVELELMCFPSIDPEHLLSVDEVVTQAEIFPEGAFMVLDDEWVVGIGSGIFLDYDLTNIQHTMDEVLHDGIRSHDPAGEWYYGIDIAVHPEYRGKGIGKRLYELRKQVVRDFGRKGIIAGGVLPGYADHKHAMSAEAYVKAVAAGELADSTLSFQLANGFEVLGAIANYVDDPETDGWASFIVWHNPNVVG
ncbi:MAG: GNAT family N-acetyltransferase [Acidimicrobiia bacterium]